MFGREKAQSFFGFHGIITINANRAILRNIQALVSVGLEFSHHLFEELSLYRVPGVHIDHFHCRFWNGLFLWICAFRLRGLRIFALRNRIFQSDLLYQTGRHSSRWFKLDKGPIVIRNSTHANFDLAALCNNVFPVWERGYPFPMCIRVRRLQILRDPICRVPH